MTSLVSTHIRRQKDLVCCDFIILVPFGFCFVFLYCTNVKHQQVDARLVNLRETVKGNTTFLDSHISSVEGITTEAKRKWQDYFMQAENDVKDSADFSAAKHCRMELLLQER